MERVTFQDQRLQERLSHHCVLATRNLMVAYRGPRKPAPLDEVARALEPGDAASNIAVFFTLPDGRVLHIVPGWSSPERLERELEFALSVRGSLEGKTRARDERTVAKAHRERARSVEHQGLARAHDFLARRPLVEASLVVPADYADPTIEGPSGPGKVAISFDSPR